MKEKKCRFCSHELKHSFANLGMSPPSNAFLTQDQLREAETFFPLHALVCDNCFLVQLEEFESPENIFNNYAYFSSYSELWLEHCKKYSEQMIERFGFDQTHQVIEIASNDGYLLQFFQEKGIPILGIEPASNVAKVAEEKGIPTLVFFLGVETAKELVNQGKQADLLIGNNVLAHVPNLNDFVAAMKLLLKPEGIITMEFPHLFQLMRYNQFDTIYHEHFSYYSVSTVKRIFEEHDLELFDVEEIPTHGGSLRIYAKHTETNSIAVEARLKELQEKEQEAGLDKIDTYIGFREKVEETKRQLLSFLIEAKEQGKSIVGYGAPAKGNTLLNYCGIREDFLDYTVDKNPHKQGLFLPGTHIPIEAPDKIQETQPDYVLILPWNIKEEIMKQMAVIRNWGGKFVIPISKVEVIP